MVYRPDKAANQPLQSALCRERSVGLQLFLCRKTLIIIILLSFGRFKEIVIK